MIHFPYTKRIPLPLLLLFRLFVVLLLMGLSRWVFYIFNQSSFAQIGFWELIKLFFVGMRFDISAIAMVNVLLILLMAIPTGIKYTPLYTKITNYIYIWFNAIAIGANLIDVIYFRYISKRTTGELWQFFGNSSENTFQLMLQFIADFWYMWVIWLVFLWLLVKSSRVFVPHYPSTIRTKKWYFKQSIFLIFSLTFIVVAIRGGFQLKPISIVNAGNYTSSQNIPLVINSPFSIIKTLGKQHLETKNYFTEKELQAIYTPVHTKTAVNLAGTKSLQKPNIIIIILESFGREKIQFYNPQTNGSITPFLDSLLARSHAFNGWANGRRSIEALPAILAGIPSLMPIDYPSSAYAANRLKGLGTLLKAEAYQTAFFHGGNNGTMHFDASAKTLGFDAYFGRNEYANESDFDGRWGIFDDAFFGFTIDEMSRFEPPFAAVLFSLSSHHPFTLPDGFEAKKNLSPFENSMRYTDFALRNFFAKASQQSWFQNSVFLITADHSHPEPETPWFKNSLGIYAIPLAIYSPQLEAHGLQTKTAQHTDIMPTLLSFIDYPNDFLAFGNNLLDTNASSWHISYINQSYQLNNGNYFLQFDGSKTTGFYALANDSLLQNDLKEQQLPVQKAMEEQLKAILQQYNNRMITNNLFAK